MRNRDEDFLGVLNSIEQTWIAKQNLYGSIIAVKEAFLGVIAIKNAIIEMSKNQSEAIGGKTIDKKEIRKKMSELSAQMGQITAAYAFSSSNEELKKAVNFSISHYNMRRDDEVVDLCKIIFDKVEIHKAELENYGITQAMIDKLNDYITVYSGSTQLNTLDIKQRMIYTEGLRRLFREARQAVDNKLDRVMMIFQFSHPDEYQLYVKARNSAPKHHARKSNGEVIAEEAGILSGKVTDKTDELPIMGATVKLLGTDFTCLTDDDGEYMFDSLAAGNYSVEVTILDYVTATLANQKVVSGDETLADFVMEKAV